MTRTHTPGPWHIGMKPGPMIYGPQGEGIADMSFPMVGQAEHRANVRLIAAAPELLGVLESLLKGGSIWEKDEDIVHAAIARARGEA